MNKYTFTTALTFSNNRRADGTLASIHYNPFDLFKENALQIGRIQVPTGFSRTFEDNRFTSAYWLNFLPIHAEAILS
jgi:hypothetical protein